MLFLSISFGLINILYIPATFYICWSKGGRFSFVDYPISYASRTKIKTFYSTSLVLIAVFQILFVSGLFVLLNKINTIFLQGLFYSGMISLALSGIVTSRMSKTLHRVFVLYMIVSITIWSFLFSSIFLEMNFYLRAIGMLIPLLASVGVPILYLKTKAFGLSEILFATLTVIWNILFLYALFASLL